MYLAGEQKKDVVRQILEGVLWALRGEPAEGAWLSRERGAWLQVAFKATTIGKVSGALLC